jgi:hypothetical protein
VAFSVPRKRKTCLVNLMKIRLFVLFALALVTTAMITGPMSARTVALVTVQTMPTPPDWRAP